MRGHLATCRNSGIPIYDADVAVCANVSLNVSLPTFSQVWYSSQKTLWGSIYYNEGSVILWVTVHTSQLLKNNNSLFSPEQISIEKQDSGCVSSTAIWNNPSITQESSCSKLVGRLLGHFWATGLRFIMRCILCTWFGEISSWPGLGPA